MKKIIKLTENDLSRIVKLVINESNKNLISEQTTLLSINPSNILFSQGDTAKQIKLKAVDPTSKKPLVLKYNIQGEYSIFDFDVLLRNIQRKSNGDLTAEVKPNNSSVAWTMKKLVPKDNITNDGWLYITIPSIKINQAITQLKQNKGSNAEIDAGQGVTINLTLA